MAARIMAKPKEGVVVNGMLARPAALVTEVAALTTSWPPSLLDQFTVLPTQGWPLTSRTSTSAVPAELGAMYCKLGVTASTLYLATQV